MVDHPKEVIYISNVRLVMGENLYSIYKSKTKENNSVQIQGPTIKKSESVQMWNGKFRELS